MEKETLIKRLDIESEFSQIMLNIDDDELQSLNITRPISTSKSPFQQMNHSVFTM